MCEMICDDIKLAKTLLDSIAVTYQGCDPTQESSTITAIFTTPRATMQEGIESKEKESRAFNRIISIFQFYFIKLHDIAYENAEYHKIVYNKRLPDRTLKYKINIHLFDQINQADRWQNMTLAPLTTSVELIGRTMLRDQYFSTSTLKRELAPLLTNLTMIGHLFDMDDFSRITFDELPTAETPTIDKKPLLPKYMLNLRSEMKQVAEAKASIFDKHYNRMGMRFGDIIQERYSRTESHYCLEMLTSELDENMWNELMQ